MALERIMALIKKIGGKEEDEEYTPRQLIDRHLDSLRRQRQFQLNEVEREQLVKEIREYNKQRERKYLWGIKEDLKRERKRKLLESIRKKRKVNILREKEKIFRRGNILQDHSSFLGKVR